MHFARLALFACCAALFCGCETVKSWQAKDKDSSTTSAPAPASSSDEPSTADVGAHTRHSAGLSDEQELKVAKLWARVDEFEEEQFRQKERIRVLEKGMTLGLVPEELRHPDKIKMAGPQVSGEGSKKTHGKSKSIKTGKTAAPELPVEGAFSEPKEGESSEAGSNAENGTAKADAPAAGAVPAPAGLSKEDADRYQALLANAHDHFRAGRYGRAIVEYSEIGKQFGDKVGGGMHLYWIAKSWSNLKEYNTARQHLQDFMRDQGGSPWAPRAKLELARVEWQLGLQETSLKHLREIIQEHPYEDAAEMAKMELETLDKKL